MEFPALLFDKTEVVKRHLAGRRAVLEEQIRDFHKAILGFHDMRLDLGPHLPAGLDEESL